MMGGPCWQHVNTDASTGPSSARPLAPECNQEEQLHGLLPLTLPLGQPEERKGPVHLNSLARGST